MHRAFDGWTLARVSISPAQGFHHNRPRYLNFPYFCMTCGLGKLGLVYQNWLERELSAFLLRMLAVGRRLIEVALDVEQGGLMNRLDIGWCRCL